MLKYIVIGFLFAIGWNIGDYIITKLIRKWMRFVDRVTSREDCPKLLSKVLGVNTTTKKITTKIPMGFHAD